MIKPKIYVHGSYVGNTGYNNHTRDFLRELSKYSQIKVRNFTVGNSWSGYSENCHDGESYLNEVDKSMLYKQRLWVQDGIMDDFTIYPSENKEFLHDFNIILNETNHHLFYETYSGPKIAFNVWESTLQPEEFFNKLKEFDELWVPSKWQRDCTIAQGYDPEKIKVVPEGVDTHVFYPNPQVKHTLTSDGRFKFLLAGRWDYRKSTKEIIETFLKTFKEDEPVDLIVSIDNMWGEQMDGYKTTEERLEAYGLTDTRIKILHFPSRTDYIDLLKSTHVFVSCARSEGWNLPLIEAMSCGTPSIYSNCCAQLEFAEGKGIPVKIIGEKPANQNNYGRYTMSDLPGNYYEPDFNDLSEKMRFAYEFHKEVKDKAVKESEEIRENFSWEKIGRVGFETAMNFYNKIKSPEFKKNIKENNINISYLEGPKVEILGEDFQQYLVEFLDENDNVVHSSTITNNMWTSCNRKYYTKWKIKINGNIVDEFSLNNKTVLISMESKSIGDTIAWAPYVVEFSKKHNCKVYFSTFHNSWFDGHEPYKDIVFIKPGESVKCDVVYRLGWMRSSENKWNDFDWYPNYPNTQELQKTATDILGLDFKELNYGINFTPKHKPYNMKYVVLSPESTAGCKEWTYDSWVLIAKMLKEIGIKPIVVTNKKYKMKDVICVYDRPLNEVMNILYHAEFLIGLSSGLSWINWVLGKHTVMISGFTPKNHEFQTNITRIQNEHSCNSCWSNINFTFDAGDWDWCPIWKGTDKQHICSKSISPLTVFNSLPL
jgi:autotransporter strand-loop-strand O-heptosyltransferase